MLDRAIDRLVGAENATLPTGPRMASASLIEFAPTVAARKAHATRRCLHSNDLRLERSHLVRIISTESKLGAFPGNP